MIFRIMNYNDSRILYFHTFSVLIDLGIGGLMAYLIKKYSKIKFFFETSSTRTHLVLFFISFILLFYRDSIFSFNYGEAISRFFISFSFALAICAQAITKSKSRLNLGNFSFANKWGKYTYGIYLIHPIAITFIDIITRVLHISKTNFTASFTLGVLGFILTLALSKISFKYYESRFLLLKGKYAS